MRMEGYDIGGMGLALARGVDRLEEGVVRRECQTWRGGGTGLSNTHVRRRNVQSHAFVFSHRLNWSLMLVSLSSFPIAGLPTID